MNLPNKLTVIRIALTPVFILMFELTKVPHHYLWALIIFIVASLTDLADGKIARKRNLVTNFGKIADPIADKIMTTSVFLAFITVGLCNIWIVIIILAREFTVSAIRIQAASQGVVIPANIFGKIKTASQMTFSIAILAMLMFIDEGVFTMSCLPLVSEILLWITAALTLISGIIYIKDSTKVIDFSK